jgi:hypothetical protein
VDKVGSGSYSRVSDYGMCLAVVLNRFEEGVALPRKRNVQEQRRQLFGQFGLTSGVARSGELIYSEL